MLKLDPRNGVNPTEVKALMYVCTLILYTSTSRFLSFSMHSSITINHHTKAIIYPIAIPNDVYIYLYLLPCCYSHSHSLVADINLKISLLSFLLVAHQF